MTVEAFAKSINKYFWYRRVVAEGAKGPIAYEFTKRRVILSKEGLPDETVWLVIRRTLGDNPIYSYYISNAPLSTRLATFVWLSGIRWAIEQCFEETKTELGMDHYEVRGYPGWNHQCSSACWPTSSSGISRYGWGKKAPYITLSQVRILLEVVLPRRKYSPADALSLVKWIQLRNHRAYLSHRKSKGG